MRKQLSVSSLVAALALVGCGDDDANGGDDRIEGCGFAQLEASGQTEFDDLFAMGLRLRSPDGSTSATFLQCIDEVSEIDEVSLTGIELVGQWRVTGAPNGVFLESAEEPRIIRYEFVPESGLVERETMSFAPVNFPVTGRTEVVSDTKAYNISFTDLRIAIFNPADMSLSSAVIELPNDEIVTEGFQTNGIFAAQVDDLMYISVAFADLSNLAAPTIDPGITVYIVDTSTDQLVDVVVDTRCSHANGTAQAANGDVYFLGDNGFNLIDPFTEACVVRIEAGELDFDPDYLFQPSSAMSGCGAFTPPGAPMPLTQECQTSELVQVEGTTAITYPLFADQLDPTNPASVAFDPVRRPWLIDLEAQTAEPAPIESIPFTRGAPRFEVDDELWIGISSSFEQMDVYSINPSTNSSMLEFTTEGQLVTMIQVGN